MLTRRSFLTTIAAAPLTPFCKTEPVEVPMRMDLYRGVVHMSVPCLRDSVFDRPPDGYFVNGGHRIPYWWVKNTSGRPLVGKRLELKIDVERRYNLPQGTLG